MRVKCLFQEHNTMSPARAQLGQSGLPTTVASNSVKVPVAIQKVECTYSCSPVVTGIFYFYILFSLFRSEFGGRPPSARGTRPPSGTGMRPASGARGRMPPSCILRFQPKAMLMISI